MHTPIYTGCRNRVRIKGALKRSFHEAKLASQANMSIAGLSEELERLDLHRDFGIQRLGMLMASDILITLGAEESTVEHLPFHNHLGKIIARFLEYEELFELPEGFASHQVHSTSSLWLAEAEVTRLSRLMANLDEATGDIAEMFAIFVHPLVSQNPTLLTPHTNDLSEVTFDVPIAEGLDNLPELVEAMVQLPFAPELETYEATSHHRSRLEHNVIVASGGMPGDPKALRNPKMPTRAAPMSADKMINLYLGGTPLADLLSFRAAVPIPLSARFEHHHIVAGTGHGKTQTLQHLILRDLVAASRGERSIVVLDSQGDLINNIAGLSTFAPGGALEDKLVLIDPTDVEFPVALNLFDVGMERINQYSQLDRERMVNGVLELYDFVLGTLLDAQMTQKQSVIFRYITRLMLNIPDATISTFRDLLGEDGSQKYRPYIEQLTGSARDFFETEFDSREFAQTKKQVLRRLWGILENQTFERMFLHPRSKLDLFSEMNAGKIILINTAKDLLKKDGSQFFGRFFIAMIAQAAQERSVIDADERMPTMVYVDEAAEYFDENIEIILSQARKYKVGMVLAHQYLGQLQRSLAESVFANTSIKFAGGLSSKDLNPMAAEMRCDPDFIRRVQKLELAAFVRGTTQNAVSIKVEYGQMEELSHMDEAMRLELRDKLRERYAVPFADIVAQERYSSSSDTDGVGQSSDPASDDVQAEGGPPSDKPAEW